jgi:hypothetical protein
VIVAPIAATLRRGRPTRELAIATAGLTVVAIVGLADYYPWASPVGRLWAWGLLGLWAGAWERGRRTPGTDLPG